MTNYNFSNIGALMNNAYTMIKNYSNMPYTNSRFMGLANFGNINRAPFHGVTRVSNQPNLNYVKNFLYRKW